MCNLGGGGLFFLTAKGKEHKLKASLHTPKSSKPKLFIVANKDALRGGVLGVETLTFWKQKQCYLQLTQSGSYPGIIFVVA